MKKRVRIGLLMIFAGAVASWPQAGGGNGAAPRILDLEECLRLGYETSARLHVADAGTAEALARLREAKAMALPSAVLSASGQRLSDIGSGAITTSVFGAPVQISLGDPILTATALRLSVQQPVFTGFRIRSAVKQSRAMADAGIGDRERTAQTVTAAIEDAYWNAVGAKETAFAYAAAVDQARRHLDDAKNFLAQGIVTRNDVLKAEMRLSNARTQHIDADAALVAARMRLNMLVGLSWDARIDTAALSDPGKTAADPSPVPSEPLGLIADGLSRRPELAAARSRIMADEAALRMARSPLFPSVYVSGDITMANPNQRYFPQRDEFKATWSLGVLVSMDTGKIPATLAQVAQASARLDRDRENLSVATDTVTQEIVQAWLGTEKSRQQLLNADSFLAQAEESLRTTAELFERGVALDADVADAEGMLLMARLGYMNARVASLQAASALRMALGRTPAGGE
jgi:outer membrane protein TolC